MADENVTERQRRSHGIWIIRDIVEVAAIVIAGIWAFYVFAYENRIKPSLADPELNFVVTMDKVGQRGNLIGVRLHSEIHNTGTVRANIVGLSYWVLGKRIEPTLRPRAPIISHGSALLKAFYTESPGTPVFGLAFLTRIANPSSRDTLELDPGGVLGRDTVFFVPAGRFDYLEARLGADFTKGNQPTPTTIRFSAAHVPIFDVQASRRSDVNETFAIPSQLDLDEK